MNLLQIISALEKEDIERFSQLLTKIELIIDDELQKRGLKE